MVSQVYQWLGMMWFIKSAGNLINFGLLSIEITESHVNNGDIRVWFCMGGTRLLQHFPNGKCWPCKGAAFNPLGFPQAPFKPAA